MNNQILRKEKHQQQNNKKMSPVLWSPKQLNNKKKKIQSCVTEPLKAVMKTRQMLRDALHTALSQKTSSYMNANARSGFPSLKTYGKPPGTHTCTRTKPPNTQKLLTCRVIHLSQKPVPHVQRPSRA